MWQNVALIVSWYVLFNSLRVTRYIEIKLEFQKYLVFGVKERSSQTVFSSKPYTWHCFYQTISDKDLQLCSNQSIHWISFQKNEIYISATKGYTIWIHCAASSVHHQFSLVKVGTFLIALLLECTFLKAKAYSWHYFGPRYWSDLKSWRELYVWNKI